MNPNSLALARALRSLGLSLERFIPSARSVPAGLTELVVPPGVANPLVKLRKFRDNGVSFSDSFTETVPRSLGWRTAHLIRTDEGAFAVISYYSMLMRGSIIEAVWLFDGLNAETVRPLLRDYAAQVESPFSTAAAA